MSKEKQTYVFSNDYLVYCAMYILEIRPGTGAHFFLNEKIQEIRSDEDKQKPMTCAESCDWIKKLVDIYESED